MLHSYYIFYLILFFYSNLPSNIFPTMLWIKHVLDGAIEGPNPNLIFFSVYYFLAWLLTALFVFLNLDIFFNASSTLKVYKACTNHFSFQKGFIGCYWEVPWHGWWFSEPQSLLVGSCGYNMHRRSFFSQSSTWARDKHFKF